MRVAIARVEVVGRDLLLGGLVVGLVEAVDAVAVERDADEHAVLLERVVVVARVVVVVVVCGERFRGGTTIARAHSQGKACPPQESSMSSWTTLEPVAEHMMSSADSHVGTSTPA